MFLLIHIKIKNNQIKTQQAKKRKKHVAYISLLYFNENMSSAFRQTIMINFIKHQHIYEASNITYIFIFSQK